MNSLVQTLTPTVTASRRQSSVGFGSASAILSSAKKRFSIGVTLRASLAATPKKSIATPVISHERTISESHEDILLRILSTPVEEPLSVKSYHGITTAENSRDGDDLLVDSDDILRCTTPPSGCEGLNNPALARLHRDLNSPSATTRMRALRALKSPTKRDAYLIFDVPHEQQELITEEERQAPTKTIREVMRDVRAYVEVRTVSENHSDAIKAHLGVVGAQVTERLNKDTTHVIFKDGLLSTYQKAKKMNIPVVSILWIEACKRHRCLMNPAEFPIGNLARYENPDLFKKIRMKKIAGRDLTPNSKKKVTVAAAAISPPTKLPVLHRLRKDDKVEQMLKEFEMANQTTTEPMDDIDKLLAAPMHLLERLRNSPVPSVEAEEMPVTPATPKDVRGRKSMFKPPTADKSGSVSRRKTMFATPKAIPESLKKKTVSPPQSAEQNITRRSRRKTIAPSIDDDVSGKENAPPTTTPQSGKRVTVHSPKEMALNSATRSSETIFGDKDMSVSDNDSRSTQLKSPATRNVFDMLKTSRRRTLFPSKDAGEVAAPPSVMPVGQDGQNVSSSRLLSRRKTLYTPASLDTTGNESRASSILSAISRNNPILVTPGSTMEPLVIDETTDTSVGFSTPPMASTRRQNLLEEYQSSLTFSSTRVPKSDRRKTIYDISMDIVDQRLSDINRRAKKTEDATAVAVPPSSAVHDATVASTATSRQPSLSAYYRKQTKSSEKINKAQSRIANADPDATVPRKRKLFTIQPLSQESCLSDKSAASSIEANPTKRPKIITGISKTPASAKRRSVAPALNRTTAVATEKSVTPMAAGSLANHRRRTTALFEPPIMRGPLMGTALLQQRAQKMVGLPTMASQQATSNGPQYLATTNLHGQQSAFVKEAVATLGGFVIENNVSDKTTHLVTLETRRTVNLLRALIRGLWIVRYEWIERSYEAGRWLTEEQFELRDFSTAIQICRSERQTFGPDYRMDLFVDCAPFYVWPKCNVPAEQLRELITLCKGKVTTNPQKARYLIVENDIRPQNAPESAHRINPVWVLDSISMNKLKKINSKYVVR